MVSKEELKTLMNEPEKLLVLGHEAVENGKVEEAIEYYKIAGEAGNTDGYAEIGLLYQYGEGVSKSVDEADKGA